MEIFRLPQTLKQILDYTGEDDRVRWRFRMDYPEDRDFLKPAGPNGKKKLANAAFELLRPHIESSITIALAARIDTTAEEIEPGILEISANTCPLLGLPGADTKVELATLSSFYNKMKAGVDAYYAKHPDVMDQLVIRIFTGREAPHLSIEVSGGSDPEFKKAFQQELQAAVQESSTLQLWVTETKTRLRKIGPHSWMNFSNDDFYDLMDNPLMLRIQEKRRVRSPSP